eukprot:2960674-Amphidinium_carterae.1
MLLGDCASGCKWWTIKGPIQRYIRPLYWQWYSTVRRWHVGPGSSTTQHWTHICERTLTASVTYLKAQCTS